MSLGEFLSDSESTQVSFLVDALVKGGDLFDKIEEPKGKSNFDQCLTIILDVYVKHQVIQQVMSPVKAREWLKNQAMTGLNSGSIAGVEVGGAILWAISSGDIFPDLPLAIASKA